MNLPINPINITDTNDPFDLPIYLLLEGTILPTDRNFYLITSNGIFLHKKLGLISGFAKVDGIAGLGELANQGVHLDLPVKIPASAILKSLIFFKEVWKKKSCEAIVFLLFSPSKKTFNLFCPEQKSSGLRLKYDPSSCSTEGDTVLLGSIHSHGSHSASHSGPDMHDESDWDGLHITVGDVSFDKFSLVASIVVNGNRVPVNPKDYIDGLTTTQKRLFGFRNVAFQRDMYSLEISRRVRKRWTKEMESVLEKWVDKVEPLYDNSYALPPIYSRGVPVYSNRGIIVSGSQKPTINDIEVYGGKKEDKSYLLPGCTPDDSLGEYDPFQYD